MKLQRISEFQHSFSFLSTAENIDAFYARFLESDLGKIHLAIPWESLVKNLNQNIKIRLCVYPKSSCLFTRNDFIHLTVGNN